MLVDWENVEHLYWSSALVLGGEDREQNFSS